MSNGNAEGLVGYARRNFMVPIPRFATWDAFNAYLEEQCRRRQADVLRGQSEPIGQRLARDLAAMSELPATPFDACEQTTGRVSSQALVRYKTNDYSVPVAYGHRDVWIRGYVDEVVIGCGGEVIARHPRCHDREDMVFNPIHYLPLIEKKTNALDQAAPLAGWDLPPEFATLRRLMEARTIKAGDPLSLRGESRWTCLTAREGWETRTVCVSTLACTETEWVIGAAVEAFHGDRKVFSRARSSRVPRDHM